MIGMGAASRYTISSAKSEGTLHRTIFTHALYLMVFTAVIFSSSGILFSDKIATILGADIDTIGYATDYIRILLMFSPLFLGNNLLLSFVRNDGAPRLSMTGMIVGSLTNIVLDYVFIYPLGMGMTGARSCDCNRPRHKHADHVRAFYKEKESFPACTDKAFAYPLERYLHTGSFFSDHRIIIRRRDHRI